MSETKDLFDVRYLNDLSVAEDIVVGKRCFVSNNVKDLIVRVNNMDDDRLTVTTVDPDDDLQPFKTKSKTWRYAYYDPYYDLKVAFRKGRKLKRLTDDAGWQVYEGDEEPDFSKDGWFLVPDAEPEFKLGQVVRLSFDADAPEHIITGIDRKMSLYRVDGCWRERKELFPTEQ